MILGRLVATLGIGLFAIVAVASGVDRASAQWPDAAGALPSVAKSDTWFVQSVNALTRADTENALKFARQGIQADPADPRGPSLLAAAQLAAGERKEGARSFAVADRTGLRTPLVQAYYFDQAIASEEGAEAAHRLDIMLVAHPELAQIDTLFRVLEQSEAGSRALAHRVMQSPSWTRAYLTGFGSEDTVLLERARFLSRADAINLGCDRIGPMLRELTSRGHREQAQALANKQCPRRSASQSISDSNFEQLGDDEARGWRRYPSGDVRIARAGNGNTYAELENRSAATKLLLSQTVALDPGEYRIVASIAGKRADAVVATLNCGAPERPARGGPSLSRGQLLKVPTCSTQELGIWLRPQSGLVRITNLRISPIIPHTRGAPARSDP